MIVVIDTFCDQENLHLLIHKQIRAIEQIVYNCNIDVYVKIRENEQHILIIKPKMLPITMNKRKNFVKAIKMANNLAVVRQ